MSKKSMRKKKSAKRYQTLASFTVGSLFKKSLTGLKDKLVSLIPEPKPYIPPSVDFEASEEEYDFSYIEELEAQLMAEKEARDNPVAEIEEEPIYQEEEPEPFDPTVEHYFDRISKIVRRNNWVNIQRYLFDFLWEIRDRYYHPDVSMDTRAYDRFSDWMLRIKHSKDYIDLVSNELIWEVIDWQIETTGYDLVYLSKQEAESLDAQGHLDEAQIDQLRLAVQLEFFCILVNLKIRPHYDREIYLLFLCRVDRIYSVILRLSNDPQIAKRIKKDLDQINIHLYTHKRADIFGANTLSHIPKHVIPGSSQKPLPGLRADKAAVLEQGYEALLFDS